MQNTPKGLRVHIGLYGRRNVGKSSLLNALAGQNVSIVSDTPGTTTDPVEKVMEFFPVGPVVFLDTAGIDDEGALGELRSRATRALIRRTDIALLITDGQWDTFEKELVREFRQHHIPFCVVLSKADQAGEKAENRKKIKAILQDWGKEPGEQPGKNTPGESAPAVQKSSGAARPILDQSENSEGGTRQPGPSISDAPRLKVFEETGSRGKGNLFQKSFPPSGSSSQSSSIFCIEVSSREKTGLEELRQAIARLAEATENSGPKLLGDLVPAGSLVVLVTPIDLNAPKGRMILPQVMAIRDLLDARCLCFIVTEKELPAALERLKNPPELVVCDSQVVRQTAAITPETVPLTTFSILMARFKADLPTLAAGAAAITCLKPGDRVLIGEACSHHPVEEDIGRVKIPRWLSNFAGGEIICDMAKGKAFDADVEKYKLIVHCGGCVITERHMRERVAAATGRHIPITNYGVAISLTQGVLERVLSPFPEALRAFRAGCQ